ncbi:MAG TPA: hypothetical protein VID74_03355 [Gemmatimonadales bacterium]|jgi:hypothetical protein
MRSEPLAALLVRWTMLVAVLSSGCDHSAPYDVPDYGGGPRFGPGGSLDGVTGPASWTGDGAGILYVGKCLLPETVLGTHPAPALIVLPTNGGQAWETCERDLSLVFSRDSSEMYTAASLAADGRLLYEESVSPAGGAGFTVFPAFTHTAIWLTDSGYPSTDRKVLELSDDSGGAATIPGDVVNWLLDVRWASDTSFVGMGANLPDRLGVYSPHPIALVRGMIGKYSASMDTIAGTGGARAYSLAEGGRMVVFARDALTVERVPIGGGVPSAVATLPGASGRTLADISCNPQICLLVTWETGPSGGTQSTYWTLSLSTGTVTQLQSVSGTIAAARISPRSTAVLIEEGPAWSVKSGLIPAAR